MVNFYNINKWFIFIGGLLTTIVYIFFPDIVHGAYIFLVFSFLCFFGPRVENSMDRVYCGQEIACHKIPKWDIASIILLLVEWSTLVGLTFT